MRRMAALRLEMRSRGASASGSRRWRSVNVSPPIRWRTRRDAGCGPALRRVYCAGDPRGRVCAGFGAGRPPYWPGHEEPHALSLYLHYIDLPFHTHLTNNRLPLCPLVRAPRGGGMENCLPERVGSVDGPERRDCGAAGCGGLSGCRGREWGGVDDDALDSSGSLRETIRSREPGAGSREPGAGSREPGAGSREPGAGSREPGAGSREPGAGSREPGAGSREPGAGTASAARTARSGRIALLTFCSARLTPCAAPSAPGGSARPAA